MKLPLNTPDAIDADTLLFITLNTPSDAPDTSGTDAEKNVNVDPVTPADILVITYDAEKNVTGSFNIVVDKVAIEL